LRKDDGQEVNETAVILAGPAAAKRLPAHALRTNASSAARWNGCDWERGYAAGTRDLRAHAVLVVVPEDVDRYWPAQENTATEARQLTRGGKPSAEMTPYTYTMW